MRIGRALKLLQEIGDLDIVDMSLDTNNESHHEVKHSFREVILVPYIGISNNGAFFLSKGDKYVTTSDGIKCKVVQWKEVHLCEAEADIERLYKMNAWDYLKKWYHYDSGISSLYFVKMKLEKVES